MNQVTGVRFAGGEYVQAPAPLGATIALDLTATETQTAGTTNPGLVHVSNTVACHAKFHGVGVDSTCMLLMPGERLFALSGSNILSFVKAAGAADGIIRITYCT